METITIPRELLTGILSHLKDRLEYICKKENEIKFLQKEIEKLEDPLNPSSHVLRYFKFRIDNNYNKKQVARKMNLTDKLNAPELEKIITNMLKPYEEEAR